MLRRDKPGVNREASSANDAVMKSVAKSHAAHFHDVKLAPGIAVVPPFALHRDHSMGDALQLLFLPVRSVVKDQNGALLAAKKLLQAENFAAVTPVSFR